MLIKLCICTVKRKLDSLEEHAEEKHKAVVIIIDCKWRKGTQPVLFLNKTPKFSSLEDRGIPWRVTACIF